MTGRHVRPSCHAVMSGRHDGPSWGAVMLAVVFDSTATWRPDMTKHTRRLWFWPIRSLMWKNDVIHKTGST